MEKIRISLFKEDVKELEENIQGMTEREKAVAYAYAKNVEEYGKAMGDLAKPGAIAYTKEQPNGKTTTPYGTIDYKAPTTAEVIDIEAINNYIRELGGTKTTDDFKKTQNRNETVVTHTTFKA